MGLGATQSDQVGKKNDTGFTAPTAPKNVRWSINAASVVTDNQPHLKASECRRKK
jgi:hypothetical protein